MRRQEWASGGKWRQEGQESARVDKSGQEWTRVDKSGQEWTRVGKSGQESAARVAKRRQEYLFIRNKWDDEDADNASSRQKPPAVARSRHVACTSSLQLMLYFLLCVT